LQSNVPFSLPLLVGTAFLALQAFRIEAWAGSRKQKTKKHGGVNHQQDELRKGTRIIYHIRPASSLPCGYARNRASSGIQDLSPSGFAELGQSLLS
jgi:hypothetical protein